MVADPMVDLKREGAESYPDGAFVVELERFRGPLDLLLHLIREQDIDIFDIPIAQITAQFLAAMAGVARLGLDRAGEFLEIAALLVRIKAQMLMPRRSGEGDELEDPRAELVRRLLEYEHYREAALRMEDAQQARARQFRRGYFPPRQTPEKVVVETPLEVTWEEVWLAVLRLNEIPPGPDDHIVAQRAVPVDEKIGLILHTLARLARIDFRHLVEPYHDRMHSAVTFVAGLELAKRRRLALRQSEPFATLWLYRRPPEDALEEELPTAEAAETLPADPANPGDAPQRDEEEHATHADH